MKTFLLSAFICLSLTLTAQNNEEAFDFSECPDLEVPKAIKSGTVSIIATVPNGGMVVMIRHGQYLSVYTNLLDVFVEKGQEVEKGTELGKPLKDELAKFSLWDGHKEIHQDFWADCK